VRKEKTRFVRICKWTTNDAIFESRIDSAQTTVDQDSLRDGQAKNQIMKEKLRFLLGRSTTRPVFVIGTGRSGTHWLGHSLKNHPEIYATIEQRPMFSWATRMAMNPNLEHRYFRLLVWVYKTQLLKSAPLIYVDKTHPNIWLAEELKDAFPNAQFIGIERNPFATVASMMRHSSVSAWHYKWKEYPIPNRFLGITEETADGYDALPLAKRCAMRWMAHRQRMGYLAKRLGDDLLVISYERFLHETETVCRDLEIFLGLSEALPIPPVKLESEQKWRTQLSQDDVRQIQDVVGISPFQAGSADPDDRTETSGSTISDSTS